MDVRDIVRMANQITDFFAVYPKQEALDGIAKHIHATWEPRLRDALKAHIDTGGAGLNPLCIESMRGYFKARKARTPDALTRPDRMRRRAQSRVLRSGAVTAANAKFDRAKRAGIHFYDVRSWPTANLRWVTRSGGRECGGRRRARRTAGASAPPHACRA
jgi:formate dehydrogenase subunit delta